MKKKKKRTPRQWQVVATAHTEQGLREAAALRPGCGIDLVEIRVDCLAKRRRSLPGMVDKIKIPLIITARHPHEGGDGSFDNRTRAEMLVALMPFASFVDVELRNARGLRAVLDAARRRRVRVILSFHDFNRTPSARQLLMKMRDGIKRGASIVKIATTLRDSGDLVPLLSVQATSDKLATMGMGTLGKVSRLVLPLAGSRLVYGYLDRPQVEGQWPAVLLAERLGELVP